jgi:hypothetical protein
MDKDSWTPGYSMRFAVDESLRGDVGKEITVETGNGGGDCGTPLEPGKRFLIFVYKGKDGKLWTGMCSGNRPLTGDPRFDKVVDEYRALTKKQTAAIFGRVTLAKPVWRDDDVEDTGLRPAMGTVIHATSANFTSKTTTGSDGGFEFPELPNGKYTMVPDISAGLDFDHEYPDRYEADVNNGECQNISFRLEPSTRIHGHVTSRNRLDLSHVEVTAIPTHLKEVNQFSGKWDYLDEKDKFDLWPLPPGDYYVGVNIASSPSPERPIPPTYYPGVTDKTKAQVIHVKEGETKRLELSLPELATPREVRFVAIGLDSKPLRKIYIQLEDLRHPGDASSYVNVDLNEKGEGILTVYAGYSYHLHGSHYVRYGEDWCAEPVLIPAGIEPVKARFIFDHKDANCQIDEIDHLTK